MSYLGTIDFNNLSLNQSIEKNFFKQESQKEENLTEILNSKFESIFSEYFNLTNEQILSLEKIQIGFLTVQINMSPEKLDFKYSRATDDELCLNRKSDNGISKLIIDTDGLIAYSFISFKHSDKKDVLEFFNNMDLIDEEMLVLKFLSF